MSPLLPTQTSTLLHGFHPRRLRNLTSTSGVALIIVLCMLALAAILLVAFLSSVATELQSAKSYAVGLDARALSDSAVNLVISQIQDATATPTYAWASQPGMIRTYDTTGKLVLAYKLYSADVLRTNSFNPNSGSGTSQSTDVPANWALFPDQYTDLNRPVTNSAGAIYPIVDPGAVATGQASTTAMDGTSAPIQGCYLDTSNGATTISSTQSNTVPMPVKWLYVLQDGTIATISSAGIITTVSGGSPTAANPVVGRFAFWTDDESCKVNVNTSGEGTFWAPPRGDSTYVGAAGHMNMYNGYERNVLTYTMPAHDEFQRYPGHPATTCLSVIFPMLSGETIPQYNERIYGIIPRLGTGGSQSATVVPVAANNQAPAFSYPLTLTSPVPNAYRLFGSVDEFLFSAANTTPRTPNLKEGTAGSGIPFAQSDIEKARFFITTSSRAPEVNMFNKPRICLWPLQANIVNNGAVTPSPACWTVTDKLIAFCSTLGNTNTTTSVPYYFQRYNTFDPTTARTPTQTYPQSLSQSPIPSSQSPTLDWTLNGTSPNWTPSAGYPNRNQALFGYLQYLTSNPIPGLGGSLSAPSGSSGGSYKYSPSVRDQILTEVVDFIRSDITTSCTGTTPTYYYAPCQPATAVEYSGTTITGANQVVPLVINTPYYPGNGAAWAGAVNNNYTNKGFGRFETIQQAAFVFYRMDPPVTTNVPNVNPNPPYNTNYTPTVLYQTFTSNSPSSSIYYNSTNTPNPNSSVNVGCVLLLNPYNCTPGLRPWNENMRVQVTLNPTTTHGSHGTVSSGMEVNGGPLNGSTAFQNIATNAAQGTNAPPPNFPLAYTNTCPANPFMVGNTANTNSILVNNIPQWNVDATAMFGPEALSGYYPYNWKTLGASAAVGSATEEQFYTFYGAFTLPNNGAATFTFNPPASITVQTYSGYDPGATVNGPSQSALVQTITMPFPANTITLPIPTASAVGGTYFHQPITSYNNRPGGLLNTGAASSYNDPSSLLTFTAGGSAPYLQGTDVVRSVETRYGGATAPYNNLPAGDMRLLAGLANVPTNYFDSYGAPGSDDGSQGTTAPYYGSLNPMVHSLRMNAVGGNNYANNSGAYSGYSGQEGSLLSPPGTGYLPANISSRISQYPNVPRGLSYTNVTLAGQTFPNGPGDWDTGPGDQVDGPYINKIQEGFAETTFNLNAGDENGDLYMQGYNVNSSYINGELGISYAPNRLISSAVAFGSLPTGIDPVNPATLGAAPASGSQAAGGMRPWQTLLFCPNPASEAGNVGAPIHPGFGYNGTATNAPPYTIPPDHAFLDFFTMPIVEPYAISEPFSTAGKVNMNYQIVPFTYLNRDTAVRAVLKSVRMMAIPLNYGGDGTAKYGTISFKGASGNPPDFRYSISPDEASGTLAGFTSRFGTGDIFRSASEICSINLVPQSTVGGPSLGAGELTNSPTGIGGSSPPGSPTYSTMNAWWAAYGQRTGDNVREEPYGYIYPRLTTKSNTYTVHVISQTLKKAPGTTPNLFVDGVDQVTSEYRGSVIVQRYLDPNSNSLEVTDGTTPSDPETYPNAMVGPYKFRILGTKRFAP